VPKSKILPIQTHTRKQIYRSNPPHSSTVPQANDLSG